MPVHERATAATQTAAARERSSVPEKRCSMVLLFHEDDASVDHQVCPVEICKMTYAVDLALLFLIVFVATFCGTYAAMRFSNRP